MSLINTLNDKFNLLNAKINSNQSAIAIKYDEINLKLNNLAELNEIIDNVNFSRECLLSQLKKHLVGLLNKLNDLVQTAASKFSPINFVGEHNDIPVSVFQTKQTLIKPNKTYDLNYLYLLLYKIASVKRFRLVYAENKLIRDLNSFVVNFLLDELNKNELYMKLKYFKLLNKYEEINVSLSVNKINANNINNNEYLVKRHRIVLSKEKTFYFIELLNKQCYMLVKNDALNQDLHKSPIIYMRYFEYYQFIAYGEHIVGLFYDDMYYVVKLYNTRLELITARTFKFRIVLHSMNKYEIVCLKNQINSERYMALSYSLERIDSFGQKLDPKKPFYFGDGSLIQSSPSKLFIYFYDLQTQQHSIKIMNRSNGKVENLINISQNRTKFKLIKIDSAFRIIIKLAEPSNDTFLYYDSSGKLLFEVKSNRIKHFKTFDLTCSNDLYYVDYLNNKILFS